MSLTPEPIVLVKSEDGVMTVTYNRPDSLNAMSQEMGGLVDVAFRRAARDPDVRALVLTGAGRAFCAGGDLKNLGKPDPNDPVAVRLNDDPRWNDVECRVHRLAEGAETYRLLQTMAKPTIAMVNGPAIGAGLSAAMACDFRIASDRATFNTGYAGMGLSGDIGMAVFLTAALGPAKARELLFFPRSINAQEALAMGLVTKVVAHDVMHEETMAFARTLAQGATLALGHIKENLRAAMELPPSAAFDIEARNFQRCFQTADHKEAVAAFREKRKPTFTGR